MMNSVSPTKSSNASAGTAGAEKMTGESRIDRESHFNGLYETKQNLRIEGVAEGEIQCEGTLTVAEGARVKAKVTASTISIAGELEGEVVCRGIFQILPSGQVQATVSARRLIVQEGGFYNGDFKMITDETATNGLSLGPSGRKGSTKKDGNGTSIDGDSSNGIIGTDEWWAQITGTQPSKDDSEAKQG